MFYGFYQSNESGSDLVRFVTLPQGDLAFPPTVMYKNKACRFIRAYQVDTPNMKKHFEKFVEGQRADQDVKVGK